MLRSLAWGLLCLGLGILAIILETDREARHKSWVARSVPQPFRGFAEFELSAVALKNEQPRAALDHAERLVRRRPIPAEHNTLLAVAAAADGQTALSDRAILISATRGWRDPVSQQVIVLNAVQAGEWQVAADRLYALWGTGTDQAMIRNVTLAVLADERGRRAFVVRLAQSPGWQAQFLAWAAEELPPEILAPTISGTMALGGKMNCRILARAARRAVRGGKGAIGAQLWQGPCAKGTPPANALGFPPSLTGGPKGPFDWSFPPQGGLKRVLHQADDGAWVMDFSNREPIRANAGFKHLQFPPGEHVITARIDGDDLANARLPGLRLHCIAQDGRQRPIGRSRGTLRFTVPATGCPVQRLGFDVPRGNGSGLRLTGG